jgi:hypothetical protein
MLPNEFMAPKSPDSNNLSTAKLRYGTSITWLKKSDFGEKSDFYLNIGRTPNCSLVKEIRFLGKIGFLFYFKDKSWTPVLPEMGAIHQFSIYQFDNLAHFLQGLYIIKDFVRDETDKWPIFANFV